MNLNGTFFLQIIHFLIAYFLIHKIFLKKAIALVVEERATADLLKSEIIDLEKTITVLEQNKIEQWHSFRHTFAQRLPAYPPRMPVLHMHQPTPPSYHVPAESEEINFLAQHITKKVIHDL